MHNYEDCVHIANDLQYSLSHFYFVRPVRFATPLPAVALLAYRLQESLVKNLAAEDRGLRRARFEVLRTSNMPAVLVEGGFLTDTVERGKIADPKYRALMATAIVQGVQSYKNTIEK